MKKVAFLFLIYDALEQEELWRRFFADADPDQYSILIHYKEDRPLRHFEPFKLSACIDTKYADVSLVHAHNLLLREAMKDPDNDKFVFVSQSCVPLKTFPHVYQFLTQDDSGYFNLFPVSECFPRCDSIRKRTLWASPATSGYASCMAESSNGGSFANWDSLAMRA